MQATDRITLVLRAKEGDTLEQVMPFVQLGAPVSIGRGLAVIAGASDEDLQMVLDQERDERQLQQEALGAATHLAAHAQEMFDLLARINTKCGGLDAALGHGIEPSEQMWTESREAMEAIWDLLDKVKAAEAFGVATSMHIDDRVKMAANAKRYEWLRDRTCIEDADNDIMVVRGDQYFDGDELDREIDNALRLARLEELHPCAD
ncbi:hypothetical protein EJJ20_35045 [Pseudomonas poae]|nr:hypothetical protein EJJ20_35045 [Pseudomonas poae]